MYKNVEDAVAVLSGLAEDTLIAAIVSLAMPVVMLDWTDRIDSNPLTFTGGAPVWSDAREWPTPPLPNNIEELSDRGGDTHRRHLRENLTAQLPYSFVGQFELQAVDAPGLPKTGRLHFFYDIATGPWDTGQRSAHVIWDQTPAADLVEASVPAVLLAAEAKDKERAMQPVELDEATLEILRQTGMSEAEIAELQAETVQPPRGSRELHDRSKAGTCAKAGDPTAGLVKYRMEGFRRERVETEWHCNQFRCFGGYHGCLRDQDRGTSESCRAQAFRSILSIRWAAVS